MDPLWYKIEKKVERAVKKGTFPPGQTDPLRIFCGKAAERKDMKIIVIDGQGGSLGKQLITQLRKAMPDQPITAIGTNSIATSVMLKAGADAGATGENPVLVGSSGADLILGPIGVLIADSLLGEITPAMASAVGRSPAIKILIPVSKCNCMIAGTPDLPLAKYIESAVAKAAELVQAE